MKEPIDPKDPLASIEDRLQTIVPASIPSDLASRLNSSHRTGKIIRRTWRWVTLAAAASVTIAAAWIAIYWHTAEQRKLATLWQLDPHQPAVTTQSIRIYAPVSSRNLLLAAREIGVIEPQNAPPVRLVRCLWVDDSTYRPDNGGDDLQVTRAREQIIPVALEIY